MTLRIVTDSTCDLPREAIQALGITVVPLSILFGDEELMDGVDIQTEQFFRRLERDPHMPTTAQPAPALFARAYQRLIDEGATEILSIHLSEKLSGTFESARLGAEGIEYLRRGGRMSRGQEFLGTLLKVKPVLSIQDGEVVPVGRVRTRQRAIEDILSRCADLRPVEHLSVIHSTTTEEANYMRDRLAALDANATITVGRITPVVGVHGGPGVLGVGIVTAPDEQTRMLSAK